MDVPAPFREAASPLAPEPLNPRRIVQLDDKVICQIAAGEVVERPASVVKELLENAIDADAHEVSIEVAGGGTELIKVTDDGHGMTFEDAKRCLLRHATSKIRSAEDLESVQTLGFRGEAIASIASVSRLTLTTLVRGQKEATQLVVAASKVEHARRVGAPPGTCFEVSSLFYNVPARRKFLKRPATEMSHIQEAVVRLAIARPDVGFRLLTEGRTLLSVPREAKTDPVGRLGRILGRRIQEALVPVAEVAFGDTQVRGFVSLPGFSERTARNLYVFVNGRFVRDRIIQHAIQDAYRTLLERGRYPAVVLFLTVDPGLLDVNVHPQKTEVRFGDSHEIHRSVSSAIQRTLRSHSHGTSVTQPHVSPSANQASRVPGFLPGGVLGGSSAEKAHEHGVEEKTWGPQASSGDLTEAESGLGPEADQARQKTYALGRRTFAPGAAPGGGSRLNMPSGTRPYAKALGRFVEPERPRTSPSQPEMLVEKGPFGSLMPVGQVLGTYLVCAGPDRMVLIDQHAAHERVAFEKMRAEAQTSGVKRQPLLVPLSLELDGRRHATAEDHGALLSELGFDLEPFGGTTWLVKSCPIVLDGTAMAPVVFDLLDELHSLDVSAALEDAKVSLLARAACHRSVRSGDRLQNEEVRALLEAMDAVDFGRHCPHGRPVFVNFAQSDLESLFHRR